MFSLEQESCCINIVLMYYETIGGGRKVWAQNIDNIGAEGVKINVLNIQK